MNDKTPYISVIILCYQSGDTIRSFVGEMITLLEKYNHDWEIVLVANYFKDSGDVTPDIVKEIAAKDKRIKTVTKIKEGMMGWDMKSGFEAASGQNLAVIDGDGQMPPEDVLRVYKRLKEENLDLVKTYRVRRDDGFYRVCLSVIFNITFKVLFPGLGCRDINSKPKIMRREFYKKMDLQSNGWFTDTEIMIQSRRMKLNIREIPTTFKNLYSRPSFVKIGAILEFTWNLICYRFKEFSICSRKDKEI